MAALGMNPWTLLRGPSGLGKKELNKGSSVEGKKPRGRTSPRSPGRLQLLVQTERVATMSLPNQSTARRRKEGGQPHQ